MVTTSFIIQTGICWGVKGGSIINTLAQEVYIVIQANQMHTVKTAAIVV